ncbi:hypothetical protein AFGD_008965 [Aspergillus flavus]|nr:hypothetical protein AFGD_008965 [Aspergillus flavus]
MASTAFPTLAKKVQLSDGTTYGYVAVPPSTPVHVSFLLHGYPSSSYVWRHQIAGLQEAGYGVISPDLLGCGDTDKPSDLKAYRNKTMMTIAVAYIEPGTIWDIDAICETTKSIMGYETFGYWKWHNTDEPASVFTLLYPHDPSIWKSDFAPTGKAVEFVRSGRINPLPSWFPLDEYTIHDRIFAKGGYAGPLSWYKAAIAGVNAEDEAAIPKEDGLCPVPSLFVAAKEDYVCRED